MPRLAPRRRWTQVFLADTIIQIYATSTGASSSPADGMGVRMGLGGYLPLLFFFFFLSVLWQLSSRQRLLGFWCWRRRLCRLSRRRLCLCRLKPHVITTWPHARLLELGCLSDWSETLFFRWVFRFWSTKLCLRLVINRSIVIWRNLDQTKTLKGGHLLWVAGVKRKW